MDLWLRCIIKAFRLRYFWSYKQVSPLQILYPGGLEHRSD